MKKIFWYCSIIIIFFNTLIALLFKDYPLLDTFITIFSAVAILFMFYIILFEKKADRIVRIISLIFGLAGIAKLALQYFELDTNISNAVLLCATISTLLAVLLPLIVEWLAKN